MVSSLQAMCQVFILVSIVLVFIYMKYWGNTKVTSPQHKKTKSKKKKKKTNSQKKQDKEGIIDEDNMNMNMNHVQEEKESLNGKETTSCKDKKTSSNKGSDKDSSSSSTSPSKKKNKKTVKMTKQQDIDDDSSDSDTGKNASQILTSRYFTPTAMGKKSKTPAVIAKYTVQQRVFGRFQNGADWFPGTITKVAKGLYTISYDDGEVETKVPQSHVRSEINDEKEEETKTNIEMKTGGDTASSNSSDDVPEEEETTEDGWEVVKKPVRDVNRVRYNEEGEAIVSKKSRESRRRKERQREKKEAVREDVQVYIIY